MNKYLKNNKIYWLNFKEIYIGNGKFSALCSKLTHENSTKARPKIIFSGNSWLSKLHKYKIQMVEIPKIIFRHAWKLWNPYATKQNKLIKYFVCLSKTNKFNMKIVIAIRLKNQLKYLII